MNAIVTVVGQDKVGIIAAVCALLAENNVNILDITQTILQGSFTMVMAVDVSKARTSVGELRGLLEALGEKMEISIFSPRASSSPRSSPTEVRALLTSTAMTMVKDPCKMVWVMSRMLTLFSASRAQTAAMMPTLSCPTTVTMAFIVSPPCGPVRRTGLSFAAYQSIIA